MLSISERIVSINNVVANQSKVLMENLLEMDANAKKFSVLHKQIYRDYFFTAKNHFDTALTKIKLLTDKGYTLPRNFMSFELAYRSNVAAPAPGVKAAEKAIDWVDEKTLNGWLAQLAHLRDANQDKIEHSLRQIHNLTLKSTHNGRYGFALSVATAVFGIWFISKSILMPLKQLTHGLRTLSQGDYAGEIQVKSKDEFSDLATAFNDMNRELREQENVRTDFIATLSHEIRTPLSSIKESVNMMAEEVLGPVTEKQHKFLTIAASEIVRINTLLNHLMQVSSLEAAPSPGKVEPLEPQQLVGDCLQALSSSAKRKRLVLSQSFQPGLPAVSGVREEIQQVLLNIVGNAVKFSPGNREVRVAVQKAGHSGYVLFEVHDHGPGVPENERFLVFNKYYRSKAVRRHMDGVGLGLFISKRIIQTAGGTIKVTGNAKGGSTFSFTLPIAAPKRLPKIGATTTQPGKPS